MKKIKIIKLLMLISIVGTMELKADYMNKKIATFAGGCFWCVQQPFTDLRGVVEAISGYSGGHEESPSYEEVASGKTGHLESVRVVYDPSVISYSQLLDHFWKQIDPTDTGGQFADRGLQYTTAIFYHDEEQKRIAEESKTKLDESGIFDDPVVTKILPAAEFYRAEDYHQDYAAKHPVKYKTYKHLSGRTPFIKKTWDNNTFETASSPERYRRPPDRKIRDKLTPLQYEVTQLCGTEKPFSNAFWDNKKKGIYVDVVTGEPLFSSRDKYKSGTGWPSFTRPLEPENIVEKDDFSIFMKRTEVRSRNGDSHLGHVFEDGPPPTGMRYCINSASLRFIPVDDLEKEGYGEYLDHFNE